MFASRSTSTTLLLLFFSSLTLPLTAQSPQRPPPDLGLFDLRVGVTGVPTWMAAKVFQVIDEKSMLVGLEDTKTNKGKYDYIVMVKCDTSGIVDGKFYGPLWKDFLKTEQFKVTGTTTYKTTLGGSKTVFVIEAYRPPVPKPETPVERNLRERIEKAKQDSARRAAERRGADLAVLKEITLARKMEEKGFRADALRRYEIILEKYQASSYTEQVKKAVVRLKAAE